MKEQNILKTILLAVCNGPVRLWRQNAGQGWVGKVKRIDADTVLIRHAQPLRAGFRGLSDLGGYKTVTITPEMVGQKVAVYCAVEVKTPTGRTTKEQKAFLRRVTDAGGMAGIARSAEEAQAILNITH